MRQAQKRTNAALAVVEAEKALRDAQSEVVKLQLVSDAHGAIKAIREAAQTVWSIGNNSKWTGKGVDQVSSIEAKIYECASQVAVLFLGAGERVKALNSLDPGRWPLEGEYTIDPWSYTEDDDVAYSVATWLFDRNIPLNANDSEYQECRDLVIASVGKEIAHQGFKFYLEGRHDT